MKPETGPRVSTGVHGLDEVLGGGLPREGLYLVRGDAGTGKTTLALQFAIDGASRGEPVVYITLAETEKALRGIARSHGWSLGGIVIHELGGVGESRSQEEQYTLFHPTEIELGELTRAILAATSQMKAPRVVIDALSELRLLSGHPLRYRRQILALARIWSAQEATVLLLDADGEDEGGDTQIESLARGVIHLEQLWPELGDARRRLRVMKVRGIGFRGGYHDFTLETGGMVTFPRLRVEDLQTDFAPETVSSGVPALDELLGGGIDRGATMLVTGPTGSGRSVIATQLALAAADRGEQVGIFLFDEVPGAVLARADGLRMGVREHVQSGRIAMRQIDPGELSPWQFVRAVLEVAQRDQARLIVIDSLQGYLHAMLDERSLDLALHELLSGLAQLGVVTVLTLVRRGVLGERSPAVLDITYLSDTVVLLNLFEAAGEMRRSVSIVKRRRGPHDHSIRELQIGPTGMRIGGPFLGLQGVLTTTPTLLDRRGRAGEIDEPEEG